MALKLIEAVAILVYPFIINIMSYAAIKES